MSRQAIESTYIQILAEACSPEDWQVIITTIVEQAKAGDLKSAHFLARWLLKDAPGLLDAAAQAQAEDDPVEARARELKQRQKINEFSLGLLT